MRAFSHTWRYIRRSPYQALAAITIMTLTFLAGGLFGLLSLGSNQVLTYFEQKPQLIVFFKDTKDVSDIQKLADNLRGDEKVASVKYVSKEEALTIYQEQFKDDPLLLEMVSADILPASLEVSTTKIEHLAQLASVLRNESDVSDIVFPEDVVNILVSWISGVRVMGAILVGLLTIASLFTVITVVGMKIALRQEEIEIMRLVGATKGYIRSPFLWEGVVYGLVGSIIGSLANIGLLLYATPFLQTLLTGIPLFPLPILFYFVFVGIMLTIGLIFGLFSSMLAINRYLRR